MYRGRGQQRAGRRFARYASRLAIGMLVVTAAVSGGSAWAAGPDLSTVLSRNAFRFVIDELTARVPRQYALDEYPRTKVGSCSFVGGGGMYLSVLEPTINLDWRSLELTPADGKLILTFIGDVNGSAKIVAENVLCVTGKKDCSLVVTADDVDVAIEVAPTVQGGKVQLEVSDIYLDLDTYNVDLDIKGCGIVGDIAESFYETFETDIIDQVRDELEEVARDQLVENVEKLLDDFRQISGDAEGFRFDAQLTEVPIDEDGIGLDFTVSATATRSPSCTISDAVPPPAASPERARFKFRGEHLGVAVSAAMIENALVQAWRAGLFCFAGEESSELGGAFSVQVPNPPEVTLVPDNDAHLELMVSGVVLELKDSGVKATLDAKVDLSLGLDLSSAVLLIAPEVQLQNLRVESEREQSIDYEKVIAKVVPPLVREQLSNATLVPRVLNSDGGALGDYFVSIARAVTTAQHILVYAVLTKRPANDTKPPETTLVSAPDGWGGAATRLVATGVDDQTPTQLMRYRWRVDDGPWTAPEISAIYTADLTGGEHTVQVAAVDLNDNIDPSPASATFQVDAEPPKITITRAPPETLRDRRFSVAFTVEDDRTPVSEIKVRVLFERQTEGPPSEDDLTRMEDVVVGLNELTLFAMGSGQHTLSLVAEDQGGNRSLPAFAIFNALDIETKTDETTDLSPMASGGCCAVHGDPGRGMAGAILTLVLLGLRLGTRRRRRCWRRGRCSRR
jgi:flavodoxin